MKQLSVLLLAASAAVANPLTYPCAGQWNFSVGIENGVEYVSGEPDSDILTQNSGYILKPGVTTTCYKIASTQTAGYGKWFYLQSRLSYSIGYSTAPWNYFRYYNYSYTRANFFDGDWTGVFPFRLPSRNLRMTLGPQLGLAYFSAWSNTKFSSIAPTTPQLSFLAPLIGLVFGFEPTAALAIRTGLNFQFPRGKASGTTFRGVRHGLDAYINFMYQISKYLELSGTLEHKAQSARGYLTDGSDNVYPNLSYYRTSGTFGVKWVF